MQKGKGLTKQGGRRQAILRNLWWHQILGPRWMAMSQEDCVPLAASRFEPALQRMDLERRIPKHLLAAWYSCWHRIIHGSAVQCSCCGRDTMFSLRGPEVALKS